MSLLNQTTTKGAGQGVNSGVGYPPNASWSNPDRITADDGSSASIGFFEGGQDGDTLIADTFGFNLPSNAVIDGIAVTIDGSNTGCSGNVSLDTNTESGAKDAGTLNTTYGGSTDLWGMTSVDPADINSNGLSVSVILSDVSGGDGFASIDYIEITIYWHFGSGDPADVPQRYDYKFYNKDESFLGNLPNVTSPFTYSLDMNSVGSQLDINVATSPDYVDTPSLALGSIAGWLEGWDHRLKMTITRDKVEDNLDGFPILVDLSDFPRHFWENVDSDGADLRITTRYGTTEVPYEIRDFDTATKTGRLWFKSYLSPYENSVYYFYYGNASASAYADTDPLGSQAVWSEFNSIWHLNEQTESSERSFNGIDAGVSSDTNLSYAINTWGGAANPGEITITGSILKDLDGNSKTIGSLNKGVATQTNTGDGYGFIMYSAESVHTRFSATPPNASNADHFIGVRWTGTEWQYDPNDGNWYTLTTEATDLLVARGGWEVEDIKFCLPIYSIIRDSRSDHYAISDSPVTEVDGKIGKAIEFDGSDDRYTRQKYDYPSTSNLTYLLWARPDATIASETESNSGIGATGGGKMAIYPMQGEVAYGSSAHVGVGISIGTNGIVAVEHTSSHAPTIAVYNGAVSSSEWSRIALRVVNKQYKIYVNGELVHTGLTSSKTYLHASDEFSYHFGKYDGELDEIFIAGGQVLSEAWIAADYEMQNDPSSFYSIDSDYESFDTDYDDVLIKNGNIVEVWETSYYYPNGKLMYKGQVNRVEAEFNPSASGIIGMKLQSQGRDLDNILARGAPFTYTDDVSQTSNTTYFTVQQYSFGGWERVGQMWQAGASNLGRIKLKLYGTADVTVSVYDGLPGLGGNFLGNVTKSVATGGATAIVEFLLDFIDTTSGDDYFLAISVGSSQSIRVYYANNTNPYANGAMYTSSYSGGSGGGLYSESANDDLYFVTASGTPTTQATYNSQDPTSGMLVPILDDYIDQGGLITYESENIDATGLSLSYTFNVATIYEAIGKILELSPTGFYFYVDLGESSLYFKETSQTPDITLIKGRHIESLKLALSIENVVNKVIFSGGETGGSNLYSQYDNSDSRGQFGRRLERKSDNRVTVQATADRISESLLAERKDEQYETEVTVLARTMDITTIKPGMTVGLRGYGNFIDHLLLQVVRLSYEPQRVTLTLGTLPLRFNTAIENTIRGLIAEQTVNNPSTPS